MQDPDMVLDTTLSKATWRKKDKNVQNTSYPVWLYRNCNENRDLPRELYALGPISLLPFENAQSMKLRTNNCL